MGFLFSIFIRNKILFNNADVFENKIETNECENEELSFHYSNYKFWNLLDFPSFNHQALVFFFTKFQNLIFKSRWME